MAYGKGYTKRQLKAFAKQAAADTTAYVVEAPGVRLRVTGRQSADAVAARYEGAVIRKA